MTRLNSASPNPSSDTTFASSSSLEEDVELLKDAACRNDVKRLTCLSQSLPRSQVMCCFTQHGWMREMVQRSHVEVCQWYDVTFGGHYVWSEEEWHLAAQNNHLKMCRWMLTRCINWDKALIVMLGTAMEHGNAELMEWLLKLPGTILHGKMMGHAMTLFMGWPQLLLLVAKHNNPQVLRLMETHFKELITKMLASSTTLQVNVLKTICVFGKENSLQQWCDTFGMHSAWVGDVADVVQTECFVLATRNNDVGCFETLCRMWKEFKGKPKDLHEMATLFEAKEMEERLWRDKTWILPLQKEDKKNGILDVPELQDKLLTRSTKKTWYVNKLVELMRRKNHDIVHWILENHGHHFSMDDLREGLPHILEQGQLKTLQLLRSKLHLRLSQVFVCMHNMGYYSSSSPIMETRHFNTSENIMTYIMHEWMMEKHAFQNCLIELANHDKYCGLISQLVPDLCGTPRTHPALWSKTSSAMFDLSLVTQVLHKRNQKTILCEWSEMDILESPEEKKKEKKEKKEVQLLRVIPMGQGVKVLHRAFQHYPKHTRAEVQAVVRQAVEYDRVDVLRWLKQNKKNMTQPSEEDMRIAIQMGHVRIVECLVEHFGMGVEDFEDMFFLEKSGRPSVAYTRLHPKMAAYLNRLMEEYPQVDLNRLMEDYPQVA